jgi:two-component system NarL family sensor kinase
LWRFTRWRGWAALVAFSANVRSVIAPRLQLVFAIVDVTVVYGYKLLSPPGAYVPLLVMLLLPIMVVLDVSWRRAATVLTISAAAFAVEVYDDPVLVSTLGWARPTLTVVIYLFLCCTALLAVYMQARHVDQIASLSVPREELLAQTMTASDEQQRKVSEFIHDGPLQYVLAARQDRFPRWHRPANRKRRDAAGMQDQAPTTGGRRSRIRKGGSPGMAGSFSSRPCRLIIECH